jgi:hypothetical protein
MNLAPPRPAFDMQGKGKTSFLFLISMCPILSTDISARFPDALKIKSRAGKPALKGGELHVIK